MENGWAIKFYDRNDIWKIDPIGELDPVNLTKEYGRTNNLELRVEVLDDEVDYLNTEGRLLLRGMDLGSKSSGYFEGDWNRKVEPKELVFGPKYYSGLRKAKGAEKYIY